MFAGGARRPAARHNCRPCSSNAVQWASALATSAQQDGEPIVEAAEEGGDAAAAEKNVELDCV